MIAARAFLLFIYSIVVVIYSVQSRSTGEKTIDIHRAIMDDNVAYARDYFKSDYVSFSIFSHIYNIIY